jgi:serine/threonine protein kinase
MTDREPPDRPDDETAVEPIPPEPPGWAVPETVGPYRLVERIGSGGMGEVFLAEQEKPVRRRVAVKIVRAGLDTRQIITRFEAERQALALMDHPNIAKVFEAGATPDGRPYFAMEYVDGLPISDYCDGKSMSTTERLELFEVVCAAVQHAHHKGIIHRDIKSSNVLVSEQDGRPSPKVIDFGLAKATEQSLTERTLITEMNQFVGTPEYMSPEQADAGPSDVDTRTDVYSLGVLLYVLLTGELPFGSAELRGATLDELRRIVRETDPPRPSTRIKTLDGAARELEVDLDWIVMRALEKDPARRYQSPQAFAEDIRRHLENRPVEARPPSLGYRVRKYARRNRVATLVALIVLVAVSIGAAGLVAGFVTARRERDEAQRQTAIAQAVNQFVIEDMLNAANIEFPGGKRDLTVLDAVKAASGRIAERFEGQPEVEASVRRALASALVALGNDDEAEAHLRTAVTLLEQMGGDEDDAILTARNELIATLVNQARYDEAEPELEQILEIRSRVYGVENQETLAVMNNLAYVYDQQGRYDESEPIHVEVLETRRRVFGDDDRSTLVSMNNLAFVYYSLGRVPEALELWREHSRLAPGVYGEEHPETLNNAMSLGGVLVNQERYDEAVELLESKLAISERALGPDHDLTVAFLNWLGAAHRKRGDLQAAESVLKKAAAGFAHTLGPDHPQTSMSESLYGLVLVDMGRPDDAEPILAEAVQKLREQFPEGHAYLAMALSRQAKCFVARSRYQEAEAAFLEAHAVIVATAGPDHPLAPDVAENLANFYDDRGRPNDAAKWRGK